MARLAELSLYLHIPFCIRRCRYCDFYSETGGGSVLFKHYAETLIERLDRALDRFSPECVPTVFIGGGTPSRLGVDAAALLFNALRRRLGPVDEFTVEVNPESLSREFLAAASTGGVNRISMGVQTYDERLLRWLGRPAGAEALHRADRILKRHWKGRLNRDLLAALPGAPDRLSHDLSLALLDHPGHLSLYELTVEPGTPLAADIRRLSELPEEDQTAAEWSAALDTLAGEGYQRYEVSNFAKPGQECRHNLNYWRLGPYLGLGPGAASTVPVEGRALRLTEPGDLARWQKTPADSVKTAVLTPGELALEHLMTGLRTAGGIDRRRFSAVFGIDPVNLLPHCVERWERRGLLAVKSDALAPTSRGFDRLDSILVDVAGEIDAHRWITGYRWPPP